MKRCAKSENFYAISDQVLDVRYQHKNSQSFSGIGADVGVEKLIENGAFI